MSSATWSDSFESGSFDAWSWWGQGDPSYGHRAVVSAASENIPAHSGTKVARFETTPDDIAAGRLHAKIYKSFGTNLGTASSHSPSDVSGTYSAWYYLPANYNVPSDTWVNVFQFKEKYHTSGGDTSDPLWWVQLGDSAWGETMGAPHLSRRDAPVAFINRWNNDWKVKRPFVAVPLGRWFEIRATVRQGDGIDFSLDGQSLGTTHASEYPVNPTHGAQSTEWIWGVGNYSTAANGPLYIDDTRFNQG